MRIIIINMGICNLKGRRRKCPKTVHILEFPLIVVCSLFMSDIAKSKFPQ